MPAPWRARFGTGWSARVLDDARVLEDIENRLDLFPTEGSLGQFIQCGGMKEALHGAMHEKWDVPGSPNALTDFYLNPGNAMFWKVHGWLDGIWERYRVAKGLPTHEPELARMLEAQCQELESLSDIWRR